jgi:cation:H+ antiporter
LPEIAASVIASLRGERDIAVGNVVGSSLFNILAVLGLTATVAPAGIPVPEAVLWFDMPIMLAATIACLPFFFTGYRIDRWEGAVFIFYYAAYMCLLVLDAIDSTALPMFELALMAFFVPLTLITIAVTSFRAMRKQ